MARMSNRTARIVKWSALPAALLVSGLVVSQASYSAFTAETTNKGNNWTSGAIELSDNDNEAALFSVSDIKPGDWGSKCIVVTADSSVADTTVAMTATTVGTPTELNKQILVQVTDVPVVGDVCPAATTALTPAGGDADLTLFTAATPGAALSADWTDVPKEGQKGYQINWLYLSGANNNDSAGQTAAVDFTWTATSGAGVQVTSPTSPAPVNP